MVQFRENLQELQDLVAKLCLIVREDKICFLRISLEICESRGVLAQGFQAMASAPCKDNTGYYTSHTYWVLCFPDPAHSFIAQGSLFLEVQNFVNS